jgi:hypothetical protein
MFAIMSMLQPNIALAIFSPSQNIDVSICPKAVSAKKSKKLIDVNFIIGFFQNQCTDIVSALVNN